MTQPSPDETVTANTRPVWFHLALTSLSLLVGAATYFAVPADMDEGARRMATIFACAMLLWVTEAIPLFATSLCVIAFEAWWVALPENMGAAMEYRAVFNSLSNPVIFLFLGGFILAKSVQKERIDVQMAALMLRFFGTRPWAVLGGIMLITAIFSMWMSNTATTAMMIVMVQPFLSRLHKRDRFRKAIVLAVPFAANIGGIGTPIGTPPNAIAMAQLEDAGLEISFFTWMAFALPLMLGALVVMWAFLLSLFHPRMEKFEVKIEQDFKLTAHAAVVYSTFAATVFLWLTGSWHGVPTAVVAILPAAVLTVTHVISKDDFNQLEWNILMLIAGGIALGDGITSTGLDQWIIRVLPGDGLGFFSLAALISVLAVVMSTFIGHSVTTMILLPIGLAMASSIGSTTVESQVLAAMCAIMASFAMGLPISTPPNAIAYGTGQIENRDMLFVGGVTGIAAAVLVIFTGPMVITNILNWLG